MTTRKTTKKALLGSLLALVLCFSMLVGTTFAWFTDNEVLSGNKIQAGTLDLVIGDNQVFKSDALWEPGYSEPINITLTNAGSLTLKYELVFENLTYGESEIQEEIDTEFVPIDSNITEVLDVYLGENAEDIKEENYMGTLAELFNTRTVLGKGVLAPKRADSITTNLIVKMREEAGNEYQGDWCKFDIYAVATQMTAEKDGFENDQYDKDATYPAAAYELEDVLSTKGGLVSVLDDIALTTDATYINQPTTLTVDKKGAITSARGNTSGAEVYSTLTVKENTTINGEGAIENTAGYAITLKGEGKTLTIDDGNFYGATTAINVVQGKLVINGGYFEVKDDTYGFKYLINCIDANLANGTAEVEIKGGTFKGWNPGASNGENPAANFLAEGYHADYDEATGCFTVVADEINFAE